MIGITSWGVYLPRNRFSRQNALDAFNGSSIDVLHLSKGERSVCGADEDALTMAVEAAEKCLKNSNIISKETVDSLCLASVTLPFADRLNAAIVKTAVGLKDSLFTADYTGTLRSAISAMLSSISAIKANDLQTALVTASDYRPAPPGSPEELLYGDGAAAFLLGKENVLVEYLGSCSISVDFPAHYRKNDSSFDYKWEPRWASDVGFVPIVCKTISTLMQKLNITIDEVNTMVIPVPSWAVHKKIVTELGVPSNKIVDPLIDTVGDTGTAHPFILLTSALTNASPGQTIICVGIGSGCDAVAFRTTELITHACCKNSLQTALADRNTLCSYTQFLANRGIIKFDRGIRGETETKTALSVLYRERDMLLGLVGGKCKVCDTPQFPKSRVCVNPKCKSIDTQIDYSFANLEAQIITYTADYLIPSNTPPAMYGLIQFDGGGRMPIEFCDCNLDELQVKTKVRMAFRIRHSDETRGFVSYFWKAAPIRIGRGTIS